MKAIPPVAASDLERLRYWQGQMLRGRDFRDQLAIAAQLRWWHNRAIHHAFGIAYGFTTHKDENSRTVSIPTLGEPVTLLACYKETRTYINQGEMTGACVPGCCSAFEEQPEFVWK